MKKKEIKKMTKDQAIKNIDKLKKDLFNFRFQKINGQLKNPREISEDEILERVYELYDFCFSYAQKMGKEKYKRAYEHEMNVAGQRGGDAHDDNYYEKKAEKYGRKMAKNYLRINRKNIY